MYVACRCMYAYEFPVSTFQARPLVQNKQAHPKARQVCFIANGFLLAGIPGGVSGDGETRE